MTTRVYHYPACSTCKKALKWLSEHGVAHERVHIVEAPPSADELRRAWAASGKDLRAFFNTAGQSYRDGNFKDRLKTLSDDEALLALAADGKLIKRPLLVGDEVVLVGFREEEWRTRLV